MMSVGERRAESHANGQAGTPEVPGRGLEFPRCFSREGEDPFAAVPWERRTAEILDESGAVVFRQQGVEAPAAWSQRAVDIVASKYLWGAPGTEGRETGVRQLIGRVVRSLACWVEEDGYLDHAAARRFRDELAALCLGQLAAFNSPVWFNVGVRDEHGVGGSRNGWRWHRESMQAVRCEDALLNPQMSACFILSVTDDMEGIMALAAAEATLFKYGSGAGSDLSPLRSSRERLTGGGKPSGPVSFMRIYDAGAGVIKSGGRSRRAAKIQTLKCDHPDILEFIECKPKEDAKARALIAAGYSDRMTGQPDEAYSSVFFQNSNLSVRASDAFMRAAESGAEWSTREVTTGRPSVSYNASWLLDRIAAGTWACGDPGMQYHDTINRWHTCPASGAIESSNPCSEYVYLNDSACNLASLNLLKFLSEDGTFDVDRFRAAVRTLIVAQDAIVDRASYPTSAICENSRRFRPLGLGCANLGGLLLSFGVPYDSDAGRSLAAAVTSLMTAEAYRTSAYLAAVKGPFDGFAANREPMLRVIGMHRDACVEGRKAADIRGPEIRHIWQEAEGAWRLTVRDGLEHGHRNAQVTLNAPTGTIAFLMDCDTTGIEPELALVKHKSLSGGGRLRIANRLVGRALGSLGYPPGRIDDILAHVERHGTVEGCPGLNPDHLPVFDCAFPVGPSGRSIHWRGHLRMIAAIQPHISGASSKTVNMPADATVADIRAAYLEAWRLGVKAVAIYRDGSKGQQPLTAGPGRAPAPSVGKGWVPAAEALAPETPAPAVPPAVPPASAPTPRRERLPDTRAGITHKGSVAGHKFYVTVGMFPDGRPGELFVTLSKEGSTLGGLVDQWAMMVSIGLQYGVPLETIVRKFRHQRFEPAGVTAHPEIRIAASLMDYIARWLGLTFLGGVAPAPEAFSAPAPAGRTEPDGPEPPLLTGPACDVCGGLCIPTGNCHVCQTCGTSQGCS